MAVRQEIEIEITPEGEVILKVKGTPGAECLALTKALEDELGVVVDRQKTSEYYQEATSAHDVVEIGED